MPPKSPRTAADVPSSTGTEAGTSAADSALSKIGSLSFGETEEEKEAKAKARRVSMAKAKQVIAASGGVKHLAELDLRHLEELPENEFFLFPPKVPAAAIGQVVALVLSIAAMMSATTLFIGGIPTSRRQEFGIELFDVFKFTLTFMPMVFMFLIIVIINNSSSLTAFYYLLRRRIIIDFPPSESPGLMVRNLYPIMFLIAATIYFAFSAVSFIYFEAEFSTWLIFYKQFFVEIVLFWYELQTVEKQLCTVSEFIEACDDRDPEDPCIDAYTTKKAADLIISMKAVSTKASYKAYTGKQIVRRTKLFKNLTRFAIFTLIVILCTLAYYQYKNTESGDISDVWTKTVAPCVEVCFQRANRVPSTCAECLCACSTALGIEIQPEVCMKSLTLPSCPVQQACQNPSAGCFARQT